MIAAAQNGSLLGEIARVAHPSSSRYRHLLMLRFYGDTSGKADDRRHGIVVAAGWIARERQWAKFEGEWSRALKEAGAKEFHATDFFSCRGQFEGWDQNPERHVSFARRFTAIAERHAIAGRGFGMRFAEEYKAKLRPVFRRAGRRGISPLSATVTRLLESLSDTPMKRGEKIAVVFECEPGMGEVLEFLHWLKRESVTSWMDPYVSFTTAGKELLPLQAADLLAHESWRFTCEHHRPSGRAMRKSMKRLTRNNRVTLSTIPEHRYAAIAERYEAMFRKV